MCPPKACDCPPKPRKKGGGLLAVLGLGLKAAFAGALVFATVEAGIWGPPESTEALYSNMYKSLVPEACGSGVVTTQEMTLDDACEAERQLMMMVCYFFPDNKSKKVSA